MKQTTASAVPTTPETLTNLARRTLAVDPGSARAGIMPGYGIEPFLKIEDLNALLESAEQHWIASAWADGFSRLIDGLEILLEDSIHRLTEIFGHDSRPPRVESGEF